MEEGLKQLCNDITLIEALWSLKFLFIFKFSWCQCGGLASDLPCLGLTCEALIKARKHASKVLSNSLRSSTHVIITMIIRNHYYSTAGHRPFRTLSTSIWYHITPPYSGKCSNFISPPDSLPFWLLCQFLGSKYVTLFVYLLSVLRMI